MKVNKTQAVLYILNTLINNGSFIKEDILDELELNIIKFKRYMQELRAFIANFNISYEIKYDRKNNKYLLKKQKNT